MTVIAKFKECVPEEVAQICENLWREGIVCTVVGGIPRDYYSKILPLTDWDFEIRRRDGFKFELEQKIQDAFNGEIKSLGFGIYRKTLESGTDLEFSLPRQESFSVDLEYLRRKALGHKDLEVEINEDLSFEESFNRRDLTINAIGLSFNDGDWVLIDPFDGLKDLNDKKASPCSENFPFDPVRILRAVRFKLLFNLQYTAKLERAFSMSNLALTTDHYLLYEAMKAGFFPFMREFFAVVKKHNIETPETWDELEFLQHNDFPAMYCSADQMLIHATWGSSWTLSDLGKLERLLKLRRGRAKHFLTGKSTADALSGHDWKNTVSAWKKSNWATIVEDSLFLQCLETHKHWDSWVKEEEELVVALYPQQFEAFKQWRQFFPRELAGKELFARNQSEDSVTPSQRAIYKLWCHLFA